MFEILHCSPIPQFALDLDHRVTSWNKACEKLTGYTEDEMLCTRNHWKPFYEKERYILADLILKEEFDQFLSLYEGCNPALSTDVISAWEATSFFENMGGQSRYLYFLAAPVFDFEGRKIGVVETLQDVTRLKMHELSIEQKAVKLENENTSLKKSLKERYKLADIIGKSKPMQRVYELILKAGRTDDNVILYGETGTGKELVARAIHKFSQRSDKQLVTVNCAAIPETLLESEFFGVRKGAFTGACFDRKGYLDLADGGTLFLDEIADLSNAMQVKLLRVIESGEFTPLGSSSVQKTNIRIIAASNKELWDERTNMREDFFYRIHVIPIHLPPLRERKEDLPLLIDNLLEQSKSGISLTDISGSVVEMMNHHHWPGNIRELKNMLSRYIAIGTVDFFGNGDGDQLVKKMNDFRSQLEQCEIDVIVKALQSTHWSRKQAAAELGFSRKTLFRKMKKFGIA